LPPVLYAYVKDGSKGVWGSGGEMSGQKGRSRFVGSVRKKNVIAQMEEVGIVKILFQLCKKIIHTPQKELYKV